MQYGKSFFSSAICREHMRRYWPVPVLVLLGMLLIVPLPFGQMVRVQTVLEDANPAWFQSEQFVQELLSASRIISLLLLGGGVTAAALVVFHHMHSLRELQFVRSLPVSLSCYYWTTVLTTLGMFLIPVLAAFLITAAEAAALGVALRPVWDSLLVAETAVILFFAMAVLACELAGNLPGAVLICAGLHAAILIILAAAGAIAGVFLHGLSPDAVVESPVVAWLTPIIRMMEWAAMENGRSAAVPAVYLPVSAAVYLLGWELCRIRRAETTGDTVCFGPVRQACRVLFALAVGTAGTVVCTALAGLSKSFPANVLFLILFTALGATAADMIIRRSFRVFEKRQLCMTGILLAVVVAAALLLGADAFGYESRIPDPENVEDAVLEVEGRRVVLEPAAMTALHGSLVECLDKEGDGLPVGIQYRLKNGRTVSRSYEFNYWTDNQVKEPLRAVLTGRDILEQWMFGIRKEGEEKSPVRCEIYLYQKAAEEYRSCGAEDAQKLCEAIREDIGAGHCDDLPLSTETAKELTASLNFFAQEDSMVSGPYARSSNEEWWFGTEVTGKMAYTITCMRELGILD